MGSRLSMIVNVALLASCGRLNFDPSGTDAVVGSDRVTITARLDGAVMADQLVMFHDAAGALLGETTTDTGGRASGVVPAGGTVSWATVLAVTGGPDTLILTSIMDVQPGDDLVLVANAPTVATDEITVDLPMQPNADDYLVQLPCGISELATPGTNPARLRPGCANGATYTALAVAYAGGVAIASSLILDVPVGATSLSFPAWSTNFTSIDLVATDLPAGSTFCAINTIPVFNGNAASHAPFGRRTSISGTSASITLGVTSSIGDWLTSITTTTDPGGSVDLRTGEVIHHTPTPATVDLAADFLPLYPGLAVDSSGTLSITHDGPISTAADGLQVSAIFVADGGAAGVWEVALRPDRPPPYVLPELPVSLARFTPLGVVDVGLIAIESPQLADYDELRRTSGTEAFAANSPLVDTADERMRVSFARFAP